MEFIYNYEIYNHGMSMQQIIRDFIENIAECMFCDEKYWDDRSLKMLDNDVDFTFEQSETTATTGIVIIKINIPVDGVTREEILSHSEFSDRVWTEIGYKLKRMENRKLD